MDMFRPKQEQAPAPVAPAQTPVEPGNMQPGAAATDPKNPAAPVASADPVSPLDQFKGLWENDPTKAAPDDEPKPLDATELSTAVSKADFAKAISPEMLAAIAEGGEAATAALPAILNAVAQQTMVQSTLVNDKLMQKAITAALAKQQKSLPAMLREQQAANHSKTTNPLFDNPAIKPVAEATRAQLLQKFPDASTEQITEMTNSYLVAMGESFAPKPVVKKTAEDVDWEAFLSNQ